MDLLEGVDVEQLLHMLEAGVRIASAEIERERGAAAPTAESGIGPAASSSFRHGDGVSRVVEVRMLNESGEPCRAFRRGELMRIQARAVFHASAANPVLGILIRNRIGMDVFGTNTRLEQVELGTFAAGEIVEVEFELDCLLSRQEYTLTVATQHWNGLSQDWLDDVLDFQVIDTKDVAGVLNLNTRVHHKRVMENQPSLSVP